MAFGKSSVTLVAFFVAVLAFSSLDVSEAARNLLQTAQPSVPSANLPNLPFNMPNFPMPNLPSFPNLGLPTLPLPAIPAAGLPAVPKLNFPPLPSNFPAAIPAIPFLTPPPSATSP